MIELINLMVVLCKNLFVICFLDEKYYLIKLNGLFLFLIFVIEIYVELL